MHALSRPLIIPKSLRITGLLLLLLALGKAQAITLTPLSQELSNPAQTLELTVFKLLVNGHQLGEQFNPSAYRVRSTDPTAVQLRQVYEQKTHTIRIYGLLREIRPLTLEVFSLDTLAFASDTVVRPLASIAFDPNDARIGSAELLQEWAGTDISYSNTPQNDNLTGLWRRIAPQVYGGVATPEPNNAARRPDTLADLNVFSLFSGEAAIQETLQRQILQVNEQQPSPTATTPLTALQGPDVPSHPFKQLLGKRSGGSLPIAELVPADRWLVHIGQPAKALQWLDQLAASSAQLADMQRQSYVERALLERYLKQLKLSPEFVQRLGPMAKQAALFGPDLYLQHGSHLTLLVEVPSAPGLTGLLKLMLGIGSADQAVQRYGSDTPAYFAQHQQWLIFSTSKSEAEQAFNLARNGGQGSLGRTAEFRYMLEQLPSAAAEQEIFVYLSDPFIRTMVGPRIKIAQLRRDQARARLNLVNAGALLYQRDRGRPAPLDELLRLGYVGPRWLESWEGDRITLDQQGIARSERYGTLAAMTPLNELSIDSISQTESVAYQSYADEYSRFWRTTFDPIGVRIRLTETIHIETLILPLVNNSIYDNIRMAVGGEPVPLEAPSLTPHPVTTLSFKLTPEILGSLRQTRWLRENNITALLGGNIHIALYDSSPILALGSADLLGAFSGRWLFGRGRSGFLSWGLLASLLTQPVAILVELRDGAVIDDALMNQLTGLIPDIGRERLERWGDDGWVYTDDLENILRFHLYIRQIDNYLIVSNRQLDLRPSSPATTLMHGNAGLTIDFDQIQALAPTLHLHHMQRLRTADAGDRAKLIPFLQQLGADSIGAAQDWHRRLYGEYPIPTAGKQWHWQARLGQLISQPDTLARYHQLTPEQRRIGPFAELGQLGLSLQLVDEGARIVLELTPRR